MTTSSPRAGARWSTARTEAFSDGVLAIAITLLVLELSVPEEDFDNLWLGIAEQWPSYLGYATSFLTIGGVWLSHNALFGRLRLVDRRLMQLNLLLLMAVSFLPFPTRLMAEAINEPEAERAAVVFYGGVLLTTSLVIAAMWRTAARDPSLLEVEVDPAEVKRIANARAPSFAFYALVMSVAVIAPQIAAVGYLAIAVAAVLTARGEDDATLDEAATAGRPRRFRRRAPATQPDEREGGEPAPPHEGGPASGDPP